MIVNDLLPTVIGHQDIAAFILVVHEEVFRQYRRHAGVGSMLGERIAARRFELQLTQANVVEH